MERRDFVSKKEFGNKVGSKVESGSYWETAAS